MTGRKGAKAARLIFVALLAAALASCRLDYSENLEADALAEDVPDVEIHGLKQSVYRDGRLVVSLSASHSLSYASRNLRIIEDLSFEELDSRGETAASGSANEARLFTDTENIELSGNVRAWSRREGGEVTGDYFYWSGDNKTIEGLADSFVRIRGEDGEQISGRGFFGNARTGEFRFSGEVEGTLNAED